MIKGKLSCCLFLLSRTELNLVKSIEISTSTSMYQDRLSNKNYTKQTTIDITLFPFSPSQSSLFYYCECVLNLRISTQVNMNERERKNEEKRMMTTKPQTKRHQ